jgi:hypothetical protein
MPDPSDPHASSDAPVASALIDPSAPPGTPDTPAARQPRPTWAQQVAAERMPESMRLDTDFAGLAAGTLRFVPTPRLIEAYLHTVPPGETRTMARLREDLARAHACDASCPVSTALFLRMVCEAAWEGISAGRPTAEAAPFWRVVAPDSPVGRRLTFDADWIRRQRMLESQTAPLSPAPAP